MAFLSIHLSMKRCWKRREKDCRQMHENCIDYLFSSPATSLTLYQKNLLTYLSLQFTRKIVWHWISIFSINTVWPNFHFTIRRSLFQIYKLLIDSLLPMFPLYKRSAPFSQTRRPHKYDKTEFFFVYSQQQISTDNNHHWKASSRHTVTAGACRRCLWSDVTNVIAEAKTWFPSEPSCCLSVGYEIPLNPRIPW